MTKHHRYLLIGFLISAVLIVGSAALLWGQTQDPAPIMPPDLQGWGIVLGVIFTGIVSLIGAVVSAFNAIRGARVERQVNRVEENTNSMSERLAASSRAAGKAEGKDEERASAAALSAPLQDAARKE